MEWMRCAIKEMQINLTRGLIDLILELYTPGGMEQGRPRAACFDEKD